MISRRTLLLTTSAVCAFVGRAGAQDFSDAFPLKPSAVLVSYGGKESPGSIEVKTQDRALYFVIGDGKAMKYKVGVGRFGQQWFGSTRIVDKQVRPAWIAPVAIRGNKPPEMIPPDSPKNPLGAAALVLADNELAIHGTNNPKSIGGFVSWGCIRMHNDDITDLFDRVEIGTRVVLSH